MELGMDIFELWLNSTLKRPRTFNGAVPFSKIVSLLAVLWDYERLFFINFTYFIFKNTSDEQW
jgi:hypothetical protein